MPARHLNKRTALLIGLFMVVFAAFLMLAPMAFAKLAGNTIDPVATLSLNNRRIHLTGPFACDQTQPVFMRVTVTQRTTGAMAEGYGYVIGTTTPQQWQVVAYAIGSAEFEPGPATAVALARSTVSPGHPDDAHQWLVNVTLVSP
jgi:hypothetical protein